MEQYISQDFADGASVDAALKKALNAAPAGFGLGGGAKFLTSSDLNDITACGWYAWDTGVANVPFDFGSCIVSNKGSDYMVQQIATNGFDGTIAVRKVISGNWDPWEWLNPPMATDVEYRTAERYSNAAVYAKAVYVGALPNATTKVIAHGITNVANIIDLYGTDSTGANVISRPNVTSLYADTANISVTTDADLSGVVAVIVLRYVKTS